MATESIQKAFADDAALASRVGNAYLRCQQDPELSQVFLDIAAYIERPPKHKSIVVPETQSKKRKLETNGDQFNDLVLFSCKDLSFTIPVRKKLRLELVISSSDQRGQVRLVDSKTENIEYTLNAEDIDQAFRLPVPDKVDRLDNYIFIPKDTAQQQQIAFTAPVSPDKISDIVSRSIAARHGETFLDAITPELDAFLQRHGKTVLLPDEAEFTSKIPQTHRPKQEKAYHVNAFRGSKDGYLFFLPNGIFFGFKKPMMFFPFGNIESISYTSVLQRTFNLVITPQSDDGTAQDIEFAMIDQKDFDGIDEYIKAHGLNDASMAAERRARMYNVNKVPKAEESEQAADDGQSELQKAEQQLQDEEDELEEDYDPSGGESDGEGEESNEEADDNDEGYADEVDEESQEEEAKVD